MLIATCPNNKNHTTFIATAHVTQTWKIDQNGNFIEEISTDETTHKPDEDDIWTCNECGAEAIVTD